MVRFRLKNLWLECNWKSVVFFTYPFIYLLVYWVFHLLFIIFRYYRYTVLFLLSISIASIIPTMKFTNGFDVFSDHQVDRTQPSNDPTVAINNMMFAIFLTTHSNQHYIPSNQRYTPWSKLSLGNNEDYDTGNWLTLSSNHKPKSVSPPPFPKLTQKLKKMLTINTDFSSLTSLKGDVCQETTQLHLLSCTPLGSHDCSITKTANYIQKTAKQFSNQLHYQLLFECGGHRGQWSSRYRQGPAYLRSAAKESPATGRGCGIPSDSSTCIQPVLNVC